MKSYRPIAFLPNLARELGGIEEALFYQQLNYWSDKGSRDDGFVYKTVAEIEDETTLTRCQQDRVRRKLIRTGWLEVKKTHAPNGSPTLHYKCLIEIEISISRKPANANVGNLQMDMQETDKWKRRKPTNALLQRLHTETTTETTAGKNTPGEFAREFFKGNVEVCGPIAIALEGSGIHASMVARELTKFRNYWTEPTKSGKKQRWELQPTFDVKRRVGTWFRNIAERSQTRRAGAGITV